MRLPSFVEASLTLMYGQSPSTAFTGPTAIGPVGTLVGVDRGAFWVIVWVVVRVGSVCAGSWFAAAQPIHPASNAAVAPPTIMNLTTAEGR